MAWCHVLCGAMEEVCTTGVCARGNVMWESKEISEDPQARHMQRTQKPHGAVWLEEQEWGQGQTVLTATPVSFITCELSGEYFLTLTGKLSSGEWRSGLNFKKSPLVELQRKEKINTIKQNNRKACALFSFTCLFPRRSHAHILIGVRYSFLPQTCTPLRTRNSYAE